MYGISRPRLPRRSATRRPFPEELPARLIELYTFEGEVVLDPFMGSGQTALAAINSGRDYLGYEVDEAYVQLAQKRISTL